MKFILNNLCLVLKLIFILYILTNFDISGNFAEENKSLISKKILVLHTFKSQRPANLLLNHYLVDALTKNYLSQIQIEIENLDLAQNKDLNYQKILAKQLKY
jgi:hypothetical protein